MMNNIISCLFLSIIIIEAKDINFLPLRSPNNTYFSFESITVSLYKFAQRCQENVKSWYAKLVVRFHFITSYKLVCKNIYDSMFLYLCVQKLFRRWDMCNVIIKIAIKSLSYSFSNGYSYKHINSFSSFCYEIGLCWDNW